MGKHFRQGYFFPPDCLILGRNLKIPVMFFLFFGTRPGKVRTQLLSGVSCSFCGQKNTLSLQSTPQYFHLFWIPLFVVSTYRVAECSHCRRTYFEQDFTPEMRKSLEK